MPLLNPLIVASWTVFISAIYASASEPPSLQNPIFECEFNGSIGVGPSGDRQRFDSERFVVRANSDPILIGRSSSGGSRIGFNIHANPSGDISAVIRPLTAEIQEIYFRGQACAALLNSASSSRVVGGSVFQAAGTLHFNCYPLNTLSSASQVASTNVKLGSMAFTGKTETIMQTKVSAGPAVSARFQAASPNHRFRFILRLNSLADQNTLTQTLDRIRSLGVSVDTAISDSAEGAIYTMTASKAEIGQLELMAEIKSINLANAIGPAS